MSSKCIDFLYVIKSTIVNDCFVICVGLSLLSKTVDMTLGYDVIGNFCTYYWQTPFCQSRASLKYQVSSFTPSHLIPWFQLYTSHVNFSKILLLDVESNNAELLAVNPLLAETNHIFVVFLGGSKITFPPP